MVKTVKKIAKNITAKVCPSLLEYRDVKYYQKQYRSKHNKYKSLDTKLYSEELRTLYQNRTGLSLDLDNPGRYTEKIQWRKLRDIQPIYTELSDKIHVRNYVIKRAGEEFLVPLLGVWDHFDEIDFSLLPNTLVFKTNNGSGTNIVVKNKTQVRKWILKKKMDFWLNNPFYFQNGFEMHYKGIVPKILAEQYLEPNANEKDLIDYKFFCFAGQPRICEVVSSRTVHATIDFYDMDWEHLEVNRPPYNNSPNKIDKPLNFEKMKWLASALSYGFAHVRIDLYNTREKIYFGEMTFTPGGGYGVFEPDIWDFKIGDMWDISSKQVDL